jgi:glycosyltransferase involved in cell wall biosynthesis
VIVAIMGFSTLPVAEGGFDWPLVSVIIPVRNEAGYLEATLEGLATQDYPYERLEIVIVDDDSSDATIEELRDLARRVLGNFRWIVVRNEGHGVGAARKTGIKLSKGDFLINFSAHAVPEPDYVRVLSRWLSSSPDIAAVGCKFEPYPKDPTFARAIVLAITSGLGGYGTSHYWSQREGFVPAITYAMIRKRAIDRIGGYPPGDDIELNLMLSRAGFTLYNTRGTGVYYRYKRHSATAFLSRMIDYGSTRWKQTREHFSLGGLFYAIPSTLFAVMGILILSSVLFRTYQALEVLGVLAIAYFAGILGEMLIHAKRGSTREILYFPAIFPMIHFGYGIGFLKGLLSGSAAKNQIHRANRNPSIPSSESPGIERILFLKVFLKHSRSSRVDQRDVQTARGK